MGSQRVGHDCDRSHTQKSSLAESFPPVAHEKPMCLAQDALKIFLASLLPSVACTLGRRSGVLVTIHPTKEHRGASFDVGTVREGIILGEQPS